MLSEFTKAPFWSPDGRFIVTQRRNSVGELVVVDRSGVVQATIEDAGGAVSWQPLGG